MTRKYLIERRTLIEYCEEDGGQGLDYSVEDGGKLGLESNIENGEQGL